MKLDINLNSIKNGFTKGVEFASEKAHQLANKVGNLLGRLVTVLKSGAEKVQPYLRNIYVATVALVIVNIAALEIGDVLGKGLLKLLPKNTPAQVNGASVAATIVKGATWVGGVYAFSNYAKLPATIIAHAPAALTSRFPGWAIAAAGITAVSALAFGAHKIINAPKVPPAPPLPSAPL
jgi:hypothetical protein